MRIYVTGGTGLVGSNFIKVAIERHQVDIFTTVHEYRPPAPVPYAYDTVDICDRDRMFETVRAFQPNAIVHCAYLNDLDRMYGDRELGWQSLVDATRYLIEAANDVGAKMILISTDWVFDGTQSPAAETTPPNPINYYGVMKVVGETLIDTVADNGAVARVAGVYGVNWERSEWRPSQNAGFGFFPNVIVEHLRQNQPFEVWMGDVNRRATPTLASDAAEMIMQIVKQDARGIFHCCGGECITRMDLAYSTADVFELDRGLIREGAVDPDDPATWVPIPRDTCLDATYTSQVLGHALLDVKQALLKFRHQLDSGTL